MRKLEIAMAMLRQHNAYLLQLREGAPEIGALGLIGCFGGKIEKRETGLKAIAREVREETNLDFPTTRFTRIGTVEVVSDMKRRPVKVHAQVFSADVPAARQVVAKEGKLVAMTIAEMRAEPHRLTPATRACVEEIMGYDT